ncbi:branched-chain amino acid transport system permease protein [Bradyrhizobium sp. AZCC 2262]|uniref:branched-chain amino acid ABC transporter permease n=1 Tax=Bradyrhizobium sp. AZCC 2262 TaxID=3117022 RepID=UPI002FF1E731
MGVVDYIQTIIDGALFGATYSLIGIGFTLVFGVMQRINMSYASTSLAGAYCGLMGQHLLGLPLWCAFPLSIFASGLIGYLVYLTCFRFIPVASPLASLMATVGVLLFVEEMIVRATAGTPHNFPAIFEGNSIEIGAFVLRADLVGVFLVGVLTMILLMAVLFRARLGVATRAVAQQPIAAQLCGMRLQTVNGLTFVIAGLLGGVAGAMTGAAVGILSPLITIPVTVKGLIVTVIGGLGSIPGAIVAGLMVGAFENLFQALRSVSERDIYVMLLLFAFLVLRPGGIVSPGRGRD